MNQFYMEMTHSHVGMNRNYVPPTRFSAPFARIPAPLGQKPAPSPRRSVWAAQNISNSRRKTWPFPLQTTA
jgi:hypothetical protein